MSSREGIRVSVFCDNLTLEHIQAVYVGKKVIVSIVIRLVEASEDDQYNWTISLVGFDSKSLQEKW